MDASPDRPAPADPARPAWNAEASAAFDRHLQQDLGLAPELLMENAARGLARVLAAHLEAPARLLVLAGPGNNGADAVVAARQLWRHPGTEIAIWTPLGTGAADGLLARHLGTTDRLGIPRNSEISALPAPRIAEGWLVDGLFGVGLSRPVEGDAATALEIAAGSGLSVCAVDVPSGLDATTGEVLGTALAADLTVSFIGPKRGFFHGSGPRLCGTVRTAPIGVSDAYADAWWEQHREDWSP